MVVTASRILVIDDDNSLLRSIRLTLVLSGFDVETAVDGIDGLQKLEEAAFDLIVLDLQMPRMDGRGFFRELRDRGYDVPVLILSAYGADSACEELGAEGSISKPFDPDHLVERIQDLIAARSTRSVSLEVRGQE